MTPHDPARPSHSGSGAVRRESIAFVIPLYNETDVAPVLIEAIEGFRAACPQAVEVVLIDDGSTDDTSRRIRALTEGRCGYTLIRFSKNFGHQLAITAGLAVVKSDAAVVMDADLQDPFETVHEMIRLWREGYDVVYGIRKERRGETWFKRYTAAAFYRFFRWMTDIELPADAGDFRLMSRSVIDAYTRLGEQHPFVRGLVTWLGFNQIGLPYTRSARAAGTTKYPLRKMLGLASRSLTSFSDKPLRLAVRIGLLTAVMSLIGLVWVLLVKYAFQAAITGWASLIFVGFFFGGMQLFFLGIVGIYLIRVYEEVRGRPRYIVRDVWQSPGDGAPDDSAAPIP